MIEITVNGKRRTIAAGATLGDLLRALDLDARWVVAELNGEPLEKGRMTSVVLASGDSLELVRAVAGG
ncbi:MAG: sulfur carrier protein ThiS [Planctomycetes bacterium]|nr:sulfur carrier protein ThiS [Planctomycetota bacterium]